MNSYQMRIFLRTALFSTLALLVVLGISAQCFASESFPEEPPTVSNSQAESFPEEPPTVSDAPTETLPEEFPPEELPSEELPPEYVPYSAPPLTYYDVLPLNPPNLTVDAAILHIRFCLVSLAFWYLPFYTAVLLVCLLCKWIHWLIIRSV